MRGGEVVGDRSLATIVGDLAERFGGHVATVRPSLAADRWNVDFIHEAGPLGRLDMCRRFERYIEDAPLAWTTWDPVHLAPSDRNRAVIIDNEQFRHVDVVAKVYEPLGLDKLSHVSVMLSDGPQLLSWLGMWREAPFDERDLALFQSTLRDTRKTLRALRRFGFRPIRWRAVLKLIEAIERPAFLLRDDGAIEYANRSARDLLMSSGRSFLRSLAESVSAPAKSDYELTPLQSVGMPRFHVAVRRRRRSDLESRLSWARTTWRLTARQSDVLRMLVRGGASNKEISSSLGCSPRTAELHVAAVCAKAGVQSRTTLLARFWTDSCSDQARAQPTRRAPGSASG